MSKKIFVTISILVLFLVAVSMTLAQSTSKQLSTNFTLMNLGSEEATVTAEYVLVGGAPWVNPGTENTNFTIPANGGQAIFRQYDTTQFPDLASGSGSVTLQASQKLGAVTQILARNQTNSSGAYSGFEAGSTDFYIPLVSRRGVSADGTTNSQIIIQNTGSDPVNVSVQFFDLLSGASTHTENIDGIAANSSYYYDLDTETDLPEPFFGSASVSVNGDGAVAVVSNFYIGPDALLSFNAFPADNVGDTWVAPLVTARLGNGLSAPVTFQNLSGSEMAAGTVTLSCIGDAANTAEPADFTLNNTSPIVDKGSYAWNPVVNTDFPTGWYGSCKVEAPDDGVVFVQMRFVGSGNAAAYEGINADSTATQIVMPLVAKTLGNGFATAMTVVNLGDQQANVTVNYKAGQGSSSDSDISIPNQTIPPGSSLIHNHRVGAGAAGSVDEMPSGFVGTVTITSDGEPIAAFIQLTNINNPPGDSFMAHNAFTQ